MIIGVLAETTICKAFICEVCRDVHLEIGTISLRLNRQELCEFLDGLRCIDPDLQEYRHERSGHRRKIMVQVRGTCINIVFTKEELAETIECLMIARYRLGFCGGSEHGAAYRRN